MTIHVFTSIAANYLPKARVLALSLKRQPVPMQFHVILCDQWPEELNPQQEPFDSIIPIAELPIDNQPSWIFKHTLVELCTAVKATAFLEIAQRFNADKIFYFDPDMVFFAGLETLVNQLDQYSILLTPHQTAPEETLDAIADNEIASLKHGVFNLGFLGVRITSREGQQFLKWWNHRLLHFCYDDIAGGLFTDQRWIDLVPAFFSDVGILREPVYNVATWNLTHRIAQGSIQNGIYINGQPLSFYHFSGFDGGAQAVMLRKYGQSSPVLTELRQWYIAECHRQGQLELGNRACVFTHFDNGQPIIKVQRLLYRTRDDLQRAFPNPFQTHDPHHSYYHWYQNHIESQGTAEKLAHDPETALRIKLQDAYQELALIKHSRSFRLARWFAHFWHRLQWLNPMKNRLIYKNTH